MIKKLAKYAKITIALTLIAALALPSYATVGASDGSAFVTKAEFDSALSDFNARLTTFEAGINSKIDSQVSSYLDRNGIWNGLDQDFVDYYDNLATSWKVLDARTKMFSFAEMIMHPQKYFLWGLKDVSETDVGIIYDAAKDSLYYGWLPKIYAWLKGIKDDGTFSVTSETGTTFGSTSRAATWNSGNVPSQSAQVCALGLQSCFTANKTGLLVFTLRPVASEPRYSTTLQWLAATKWGFPSNMLNRRAAVSFGLGLFSWDDSVVMSNSKRCNLNNYLRAQTNPWISELSEISSDVKTTVPASGFDSTTLGADYSAELTYYNDNVTLTNKFSFDPTPIIFQVFLRKGEKVGLAPYFITSISASGDNKFYFSGGALAEQTDYWGSTSVKDKVTYKYNADAKIY